ncbi:hypothetical protein [Sphingomonas sp. Leaf25]|uniref:hypothetical protein n=1 Tax=Sphingomonas sp. Leaf25 TaxID=1735692 RepID=UPI0006FAC94A|nr:hypothetical protein [Sphingomonas sp. Leaf25]KQM98738.1 hypothetical protein ASE78_05790 [Sphingomonas sp. Leaf25]
MTANIINLADRQTPAVRRRACDAATAQRAEQSRRLSLGEVMNDPPACGYRGTVHVMPAEHGGFTVSHESENGNSWGEMLGPFDQAANAVGIAHRLNAVQYAGQCAVVVCAGALAEIEWERP